MTARTTTYNSGFSMKVLNLFLPLFLVAATRIAAAAQDDRSPIARYEGDLEYAVIKCTLALKIANNSAKLTELKGNDGSSPDSEDWRVCIATQKTTAKVNYEAALKSVKKPAARAALKEHFIQGSQALSGIAPYSNETVIAHAKRQGDNRAKLDELWTRFELEK